MYRPLNDWVVIEVEQESNVTASGIIFAKEGKPSQKARVIAVPEGFDVKEGDTVIVDKYSPLEVNYGSESVTVIKYADIYLVIE